MSARASACLPPALAAWLLALLPVAAALGAPACCSIAAIDKKTGIVTAQHVGTRRAVRFKLDNAVLLHRIAIGQAVSLDAQAGTASIEGVQGQFRIVAGKAPASANGDLLPPGKSAAASQPQGARNTMGSAPAASGTVEDDEDEWDEDDSGAAMPDSSSEDGYSNDDAYADGTSNPSGQELPAPPEAGEGFTYGGSEAPVRGAAPWWERSSQE